MTVFDELGFTKTIEHLKAEVQELYLSDETPWTIGYSGGKDSTAVVQLIWLALEDLPVEKRQKPVYVITTDTLVENPVVAAWVNRSLNTLEASAKDKKMPFAPHLLKPDIQNTFWVNLIGRGYPAPRPRFRWCTERLKIKPSTRFIENVASENGEVILLLGARRSESAVRAHSFKERDASAVRDKVTPHHDLTNTLVYTPIEDWSNDDVWLFLLRQQNPWGHSNKDLLAMYRGASEDNECPVVVDTSTPSCGNSRFGCWTCTLVDEDKSMGAMIQNDYEKEWMLPLLEIRNELDFRGDEARARDRGRRDFRRMGGHLQFYVDGEGQANLIHGPYTQESRAYWLRRILEAQQTIRKDADAPDYVQQLELISEDELEEIRRIWVVEKHEVEDLVPAIYEEIVGKPYPGSPRHSDDLFSPEMLDLLWEACGQNRIRYETARSLLSIERNFEKMRARRGLFKELESALKAGCFQDREEAQAFAQERAEDRQKDSHQNKQDVEDRQPSLGLVE